MFGPATPVTGGRSSAGERQKRAVFGALGRADTGGCLILLDGPDTHLHPGDCAALADRLAEAAGGDRQIVLATHQPLTVGGPLKEQVRVLRQTPEGRVEAVAPAVDPRGMGVTGSLKSELFGLPSTLDTHTERRLLRRNTLFVKTGDRPTGLGGVAGTVASAMSRFAMVDATAFRDHARSLAALGLRPRRSVARFKGRQESGFHRRR